MEDARALRTFDQHLDGTVRQFEELQYLRDGADLVDRGGFRFIVGGVLLRDEQNALVLAHHFLERANGLLTPDEKRNDHVREDDDVAERKNREGGIVPRRSFRPGRGV